MSDYQISIKIPIEALDDVEARQKIKEFLALYPTIDIRLVKAQRVFSDRPPEKITL